jgi:DNA-directed RNA polymerase I subunit RPA1
LTEGSNFKAMWEHASDFVNMDYIQSNDISAILHTYGVEAARASIINEVSGVFGVYGIEINFRHLSLIADYMVRPPPFSPYIPSPAADGPIFNFVCVQQTHEGNYKPFNRTGISSRSSPLLKASFETTAAFLSEATLFGDFDDLSNPSSSVVSAYPCPFRFSLLFFSRC